MMKIHLSIDDFILSQRDSPKVFQYLYNLHDKYGCRLTVYLQNWSSLCGLGANDLYSWNRHFNWLKFGIHTPDNGGDFKNLTYYEGYREMERFVCELKRLGLSMESIDTFHRLHTFAGNRDCLKGMKSANPGLQGFLLSDDSRQSYYLELPLEKFTSEQDRVIYDKSTDLFFKSTDMRLDWFDRGFQSKYIYRGPVKKSPYKELVFRHNNGEFDNKEVLVVFTHQWQIYSKGRLTRKRHWIEDVCHFARDYGYKFDFPGNVIKKEKAVLINGNESKLS